MIDRDRHGATLYGKKFPAATDEWRAGKFFPAAHGSIRSKEELMYKTKPTMTGGCQCGAVRYALFETPESTVCHCRMCQKAVGGPFAAFCKVKLPHFAWTLGEPASFQSSSAANRQFCRACG